MAGGGGRVGQELEKSAVVAVPHAVVQPRAVVVLRRQGFPLLFPIFQVHSNHARTGGYVGCSWPESAVSVGTPPQL